MRCFRFFFPLILATFATASNVTITTATLPNGTLAVPYTASIVTSGGCVPMIWQISAGLPNGVTSKPSTDMRSLLLSGTPTAAGAYAFTAKVTGCAKHTASRSYTVTIQPAAVHTVDLTWGESGAVVGYNVYRSTVSGGPYARINAGLVAAMLYTDSTVANATTYYYVCTAVDNTGTESGYSNETLAAIP